MVRVTSIVSVSVQTRDQLQCLYSLQCSSVQNPIVWMCVCTEVS